MRKLRHSSALLSLDQLANIFTVSAKLLGLLNADESLHTSLQSNK